jgi:hypothetical protein
MTSVLTIGGGIFMPDGTGRAGDWDRFRLADTPTKLK